MILRQDHVAAVALIALGVAAYAFGWELPFGTPASPGPGMLPFLAAGLLIGLAVLLLVNAGSSPPLSTIAWDDISHALIVILAAAAAVALYTTLGFLLTIGLLLFGLIWGVERMPLVTSLAVSVGMTAATYLLLSTLLKQPMPPGLFGF